MPDLREYCVGCKASRKCDKPCTDKEGKITCELETKAVEPDNIDIEEAWDLFWMANTCWNVSMSGITGMNYSDVRAVSDGMGIEWTESLLRRIRVLESCELQARHKK